jgi:hypothetical protein
VGIVTPAHIPGASIGAPYMTPNLRIAGTEQRQSNCQHCRDVGMVELDHSTKDARNWLEANPDTGETRDRYEPGHAAIGAPCPMCRLGEEVDRGSFGGGYWHRHDVRRASWENGLTVHHQRRCRFVPDGRQYPCGRPSVDAYCNYHAEETNRTAASSGVRLAHASIARMRQAELATIATADSEMSPEAKAERRERALRRIDADHRREQREVAG